MEQAFVVIEPDDEIPTIFKEPDTVSDMVVELVADNMFFTDPDSEKNRDAPNGWKHGEFRPTATSRGDPGWLQVKFIGPPKEFEVLPVPEVEFVQACARAEIRAGASSTDGAPAILADYLIALALLESDLTNFGNRLSGTSAIGPFQITQEEWAEFLAANPESGYAPFQLYQALAQVAAAQYLTQRDWEALEAEAKAANIVEAEQRYVPSFLLLFQSRLIGIKAAFAINQIHATGEAQTLVSEALEPFFPDPDERAALIKRRGRFLKPQLTGDNTTVDGFIEKTSADLAIAFKSAFSKLKQHFPEFAIPPMPAGTPWMEIARQEQAFWADPNVSETTQAGKDKVKQYFSATEFHPDTVEPWCGAFVAWCLKQANAPLVKQAATAASWKMWGTMELRKGGLTDPTVVKLLPGAVVVLHPAGDTGTTGHVCFGHQFLPAGPLNAHSKITCTGGNQRDTVRTDDFKMSRIAAIRVMAPVEMPSGDDVLILARTIFGEARGEPEDGQEAVAEVVLNRSKSGRYPSSVTEVCLQPSQFSCWNASDPNRKRIIGLMPNAGDERFEKCLAIAAAALAGQHRQLSAKVLHYHATSISSPSWVRDSPQRVMERKIGHHLFYSGIR